MKILEVFGEPISNGGQEAFLFNVIQYMNVQDMKIDALTPYYCDNVYYRSVVEDMGGRIIEFGLSFEPGNSRFNIIKPLKQLLKDNHYDVVHVHSGSISVLAEVATIARVNGVGRVIVHSHCAADVKTLKYRIVKLCSMPFMAAFPTNYCACSQVAGDWKYSHRIASRKLQILKNGVDTEKFSYDHAVRGRIRAQLGIEDDAYVIGHVGRFSYQKNHKYLVNIFAKAKKQLKEAKLLLIGSGELMDDVKKKIELLGVGEDVIFVGNVNNVNDYLQAMDVFVLPSYYEGLPIVGVEAQAAGLPLVVSTNVSDELKLTDDVIYHELGDDDSWVETIIALREHKRVDTSMQLQTAGYDIRDTAQCLEKLYR